MLLIQLTGLSGAGKSTLANGVKKLLEKKGLRIEVIDADIYRKQVCPDLGFSEKDRNENIRRLGFIANRFAMTGVIAILAAINPYDKMRKALLHYGPHVKTVWVHCDLDILIGRDTKHLYEKALLPDHHPEKINNLTGVNDPYECPGNADLTINTGVQSEEESIRTLAEFIIEEIKD